MRSKVAGLTMIEVMLALVLMTMTAWSLQTLYVHLMKATRMSQERRAAMMEADTLFRLWQRKSRDFWPEDNTPTTVEGEHNEYLYRVELSGLTPNPFYEGDPELNRPFLNTQTMALELTYTEKTNTSGNQHKIRIVGSVGR